MCTIANVIYLSYHQIVPSWIMAAFSCFLCNLFVPCCCCKTTLRISAKWLFKQVVFTSLSKFSKVTLIFNHTGLCWLVSDGYSIFDVTWDRYWVWRVSRWSLWSPDDRETRVQSRPMVNIFWDVHRTCRHIYYLLILMFHSGKSKISL